MDKEEVQGMKMVVTLRELGLPVIEEYHNGVLLSKGTYTHEAYAAAVLQSLDYEAVRTPILPRNTIYFSEGPGKTNVFIEMPTHRRRVYYHESVIDEVPYPSLIFGFSLTAKETGQVVNKVCIVAIEEQFCIGEDSRVFYYPYTNVDHTTQKVCWGTQRLPVIEKISQLSSIPDLFFNTPNSDCYYSQSNQSKLTFRELVEEIKGQTFPEKYLKPLGLNLSEWISEFVNSRY